MAQDDEVVAREQAMSATFLLPGVDAHSRGVRGHRAGRVISTPVWFVDEANTLYLLPVTGRHR